MARFAHSLRLFKNWVRGRPRRVIILVVVILVACGGIGYYRHRFLAIQEHWDRAESAIRNYDFAAAQDHLAEFVQANPKNAAAHYLLAQVARRNPHEDFTLAGKHLEEATRLGWPADEVNLENNLLDFQSATNQRGCEDFLMKTLQSRPELRPLILEAMARGCIRSLRFPDASAFLERWVSEYPEDWYARLLRGAVFQFAGRADIAIEDFRLVLEKQPNRPGIRKRFGMVLIETGYDYAEAQAHLEKYRETNPQDVAALVGLARCYHNLGQPEKARELLEQARAKEPQDADTLLTLALVEMNLGHDQAAMNLVKPLTPLALRFDAETARQKLMELEPWICPPKFTERQELALHIKATLLGRAGQTTEAENCRLKIVELRKGIAAMHELNDKIKEHPWDAELMYQMGQVSLRIGMIDEAKAWLLKALQVEPHDARIHQALAEYYESLDTAEGRQFAVQHRQLAGKNN